MLTQTKLITRVIIALAILFVVCGICVMTGTQKISPSKILQGPGQVPGSNIDYEIFIGVRLPRVLLALEEVS